MQASPLSLSYTSSTSSPSSSLSLQHNFPPVPKPLRPSPTKPRTPPSLEPDLSHEVIVAEEQVGRGSVAEEMAPSLLSLIYAAQEVKGLEGRLKYVQDRLEELKRARESGAGVAGGAGIAGPQEELAWAIQNLQQALEEHKHHSEHSRQKGRPNVSDRRLCSRPLPLSLHQPRADLLLSFRCALSVRRVPSNVVARAR